jgi:hypothetical protein
VVALNTYDISFCPSPGNLLGSQRIEGQAINTTTSLGTIVLPDAVNLFGTVLDHRGTPAAVVDVDVFVHATGAPVALCSDNTNASGAYSVFVPPGTYDVVFTPPSAGSALAGDWHYNVAVPSNTQLNGLLSARRRGNSYAGDPPFGGTGTLPLVEARGPRRSLGDDPIVVSVEDGELVVSGLEPGRTAVLLVGGRTGPAAAWTLRTADDTGRTRIDVDALGTRSGWLRVVAAGSSPLYRLGH